MLVFFKKNIPIELIIIIIFGIIIRVIAIFKLNIIHTDGVVYIQQARTLLSGDFSGIFSCELAYFPLSTVFIAGAYLIVGDWLIAGHATSCVFGSAMLIPLAMIFRRFFEREIVFLGVATFSVLPFFVYLSVNVIKEPVFIFFITSGLYFFIRYLDEYKKYLLIYSSLCFVFGTWARVEGFLIIILAAIFIIIYSHKDKLRNLLLFLVLPAFGILSVFVIFLVSNNMPNMETLVLGKVFYDPTLGYGTLKKALYSMAYFEENPKNLFLKEAAGQIWLIGAGTLLRNMLRALRYFFFFILLLGLKEACFSLKFDKRIVFLLSIAVAGLFVVYIFCLKFWWTDPRFYAGTVLIPSSLLICYGFKKILYLLENKLGLSLRLSLFLVVTAIFLICLPKDLKEIDKGDRVYKDIGSEISKLEDNANMIKIATSIERSRVISFYANYAFLSASDQMWCNKSRSFLWEFFDKDYEGFIEKVKKANIDYFLWEERFWLRGNFLFEGSELDGYFDKIGEWYHPDTGNIVLYKTKKSVYPSS